ncbi:MAG: ABC transporter substrate-binding protein [Halarsenatibacteraceae bacterium]
MNNYFKEILGKRQKVILFTLAVILVLAISGVALANTDNILKTRARNGMDISTLDPAHMIGNEEDNIGMAIYSRLIELDPANPSQYRMDAADVFEMNEAGTEIYFELKEGIQFHGGYGELTAEDVKFSYERLVDPEVEAAYADDFATLDRVEVIDDYSGRIILTDVFPGIMTRTLPLLRGSILSKEAFEDIGAERFATNPIGSGPYMFEEWEPGERIILSRNDDYYRDLPDFETVEIYPIVEEEAAEVAFDTDELNETRISLDSINRYENEDDVTVHELDMLRFIWIGFNHQQPPFDDIRVREAMRYAIDVDEIIEGAFKGATERANTLLPPGILGHWADAPAYQQDLEKARNLLEEAGYGDGFSTELASYAVSTELTTAQIAQYHLTQVGVRPDIELVEGGQAYQLLKELDRSGMHVASFTLNPDPGYWSEWYTNNQVGSWNYMHWENDEFQELHDRANLEPDREQRAELYVEMQKIMDEDVVFVPVSYDIGVHVSRDHINPTYLYHYSLYQHFESVD